jgi:hypothetical protein
MIKTKEKVDYEKVMTLLKKIDAGKELTKDEKLYYIGYMKDSNNKVHKQIYNK